MPHGSRPSDYIRCSHGLGWFFFFIAICFSYFVILDCVGLTSYVPHLSHSRNFWPLKLCCLFLPAFSAGVAFFCACLRWTCLALFTWLRVCIARRVASCEWFIRRIEFAAESQRRFSPSSVLSRNFSNLPQKKLKQRGRERGWGRKKT